MVGGLVGAKATLCSKLPEINCAFLAEDRDLCTLHYAYALFPFECSVQIMNRSETQLVHAKPPCSLSSLGGPLTKGITFA